MDVKKKVLKIKFDKMKIEKERWHMCVTQAFSFVYQFFYFFSFCVFFCFACLQKVLLLVIAGKKNSGHRTITWRVLHCRITVSVTVYKNNNTQKALSHTAIQPRTLYHPLHLSHSHRAVADPGGGPRGHVPPRQLVFLTTKNKKTKKQKNNNKKKEAKKKKKKKERKKKK